MADKGFGIKQLNLIGASGVPKIESPNILNINASTVAISTDVTIGGQIQSNIKIGSLYSVGVGTTVPAATLHVLGTSLITGVTTVGLGSTSTPSSNSQMSFELTSDTNLRIKVRGTDGVLRSANISLS